MTAGASGCPGCGRTGAAGRLRPRFTTVTRRPQLNPAARGRGDRRIGTGQTPAPRHAAGPPPAPTGGATAMVDYHQLPAGTLEEPRALSARMPVFTPPDLP